MTVNTANLQPATHDVAATAERRGLLARVMGARGIWALGDQAVCSAGNFLTGVLMARGLEKDPHSFGVYSLILSIVLFLNSLHGSIVTYPLTLEGAAATSHRRFRHLTRRALQFTLMMAPILAIVLVAGTTRMERLSLLPGAVLAMIAWQLQETVRRALLARLRHRDAIPGDAVSFLGQAACVWYFWHQGVLSPEWAFAGIATTSLLAAIIQIIQVMCREPTQDEPADTVRHDPMGVEAARWWRLGRWLLIACLVNVGTIYLGPWVLEAARGEEVVASYYALITLLNLTNPVVFSLCGLIVVSVAAARSAAPTPVQGLAAARRVAVRYGLMGLCLVVPYYIVVLAAPRLMLTLFYRSTSPYVALAGEVKFIVLIYAISFLAQMSVSLLNGLGEARAAFVVALSGSLTTIAVTLPMILHFGLHGALIGGSIPAAVQFGVGLLMIRRLQFRPPAAPAPTPDTTDPKGDAA